MIRKDRFTIKKAIFWLFLISIILTTIQYQEIVYQKESAKPQSAGTTTDSPINDNILLGNGGIELPERGHINDSNYNIFWFIQITDTQDVWFQWSGEPREPSDSTIQAIQYFLDTTKETITPLFIANTGDLVDSRYQNFMKRNDGQTIAEWEMYNNTFSAYNLTSYNYFDLMGNHDIYRSPDFEHYYNYSISGSTFHTDQYSVTINFDWGNYTFYMLSTPNDHGMEYPFALGGEMSTRELNWLEHKMVESSVTNVSFALGHHPLEGIRSGLSSTGKSLKNLLKSNEIDGYLYGHWHSNQVQAISGIPEIQTAKFREAGGSFRIIAVDEDKIATSTQSAANWPMGIITSPVSTQMNRVNLGKGVDQNLDHIRALAWDPTGVMLVETRASGGDWHPMYHIEGPLYEIEMIPEFQGGSEQLMEIRITNTEGHSRIESMVYEPEIPASFNWKNWVPSLIVGIISICLVIPSVNSLKNLSVFRKKPSEENDQNLKSKSKLVLVKLAILLFCPLSAGLFFAEKLTVIFGLFALGMAGVMYSDILLIFTGMIVVSSILPQSLTLSSKRKKWFKFFSEIGVFWSIFFTVFYIVHFPTVAWASIGFYLLLYIDIKLISVKS